MHMANIFIVMIDFILNHEAQLACTTAQVHVKLKVVCMPLCI